MRAIINAVHACALAGALLLGAAGAAAQERTRPAVGRGWIGIAYDVRSRGTDPGKGEGVAVVIVGVQENSPAARAGLAVGDTLLRINGEPVSDLAMKRFGETLGPGDRVRFTVHRGGRSRDVAVVAGTRSGFVFVYPELKGHAIVIHTDSMRDAMLRSLDSVRVHLENVRFHFDTAGFARLSAELARLPTVSVPTVWFELDSVKLRGPEIRLQELPENRARLDSVRAELRRLQREQIEQVRRLQSAQAEETRRMRSAADSVTAQAQRVLEEAARVRAQQLRRQPALADSVRSAFERAQAATTVFFAPEVLGQRVVAGAQLSTLNPELGEYFGVAQGVLVTDVVAGTPAAAAGLVAGDVITAVEGRDVASIAELRAALRRASRPAALTVVRKGRTLPLRLPD